MSSAQDSTGESKIVSASSRIELQAHPLLHTALHNFVKSERKNDFEPQMPETLSRQSHKVPTKSQSASCIVDHKL